MYLYVQNEDLYLYLCGGGAAGRCVGRGCETGAGQVGASGVCKGARPWGERRAGGDFAGGGEWEAAAVVGEARRQERGPWRRDAQAAVGRII